jgi:cellulose synthase/poly-beta-1,6-N-acetylglucosamine synthase-like glycosyltransferase
MIEIVLFLILGIYVIFILQLIIGCIKIKSFNRTDEKPKTAFSIIVPFRNEEKNLPKLLESISKLNYPKELFEVIMVNDFSEDNSEGVYIKWRMKNGLIETTLLENLRLSNSPKKDAISRAVPIVKNEWIITTDADCTVNKNWLLTLDNYIQKNVAEMIVGAVIYKTKNNWFHNFQQLDLLSLQGTTIGSFGIGKPFMCNGANFAYTKKFFNEIGGYGGIDNHASGDDVLLLQKAIFQDTSKVHYLKHPEIIVKTKPENDLYTFFMQRVRWASKTSSYKNTYAKILAVVVLLMNISLIVSCGLWVAGKVEIWNFSITFFLKYTIDYILLLKANKYFQKNKILLPLVSSLLYPIYTVCVGLYSLLGSFSWKGRTYR